MHLAVDQFQFYIVRLEPCELMFVNTTALFQFYIVRLEPLNDWIIFCIAIGFNSI